MCQEGTPCESPVGLGCCKDFDPAHPDNPYQICCPAPSGSFCVGGFAGLSPDKVKCCVDTSPFQLPFTCPAVDDRGTEWQCCTAARNLGNPQQMFGWCCPTGTMCGDGIDPESLCL